MILAINQRRLNPHRRMAFTLLEVLVVVAIIVVLASIASVQVFKYLEDSKKDKARTDVTALDKAVKTFQVKNENNFPDNLQQVLQYIENANSEILQDPWGKPYVYSVEQQNDLMIVYIRTTAPDGEEINNLKLKRTQ